MSEPHVNVSRSAVTLSSGQPLAPGETGEPNLKDPHDKALVDDGLLAKAEKEAKA
jgi:hypothetical protein